MWVPININFSNFISHKDTTFEFENDKTFLIQGINLDDDGQESNGSGKSAMIEAIIFALTGDSFRKIRSIDLIFNGEKQAVVDFTLQNKLLNKILRIKRVINLKGSNSIEIFINDEQVVLSSVNEYNKYILELLDISKEDLTNYFIISKDKYESFLLTTDTKKKNIISRFANVNILDDLDIAIGEVSKDIQKEIQQAEKEIYANEAKISILDVQHDDTEAKQQFLFKQQNDIKNIDDRIAHISNEISNIDININNIEESKKIAQDKLKNSKSAESYELEIEKLGKKIASEDNILTEIKSEVVEYTDAINNIKSNLKTVIECPNCKHEFSNVNKDFDVQENKQLLPILSETLLEKQTEVSEKIEHIKQITSKRQEFLNVVNKIRAQRSELERTILRAENEISSLKNKVKMSNETIERLLNEKEEIQNKKFIPVEKQDNSALIEKIKEANESLKLEIEESELLKSENINWQYNFKKFKTYLINKSIYAIEAYTNMFLDKIKTSLNVKLDGYKLLADGKTIRENITVEILRNGKKQGLIDKFSNGEKIRIDICNILALQKLINLSSKSGGLNLLILDEIIESVDSSGVNEILNQLNSLNQCIYVITHASNMHNFENKIEIVKQNSISKIRQ